MPKQFVPLFNKHSLFQLTLERNQSICEQFLIVSNQEQYFLALDQMQSLDLKPSPQFILEPVGRNTAPAIALACLALAPEALVLVTPSDHLIKNQTAYEAAVESAKKLALQNKLVTFGIQPQYAETGFGYIEADGHNVRSFKEKPDKETAQAYLDQGNYFWNSGMFCFKAGVFLQALQQHAPDIHQACLVAFEQTEKNAFLRIPNKAMQAIPAKSIDYAVMEHSEHVKVVPTEMDWSDLGSFETLSEELACDQQGNTLTQQRLLLNANNNLIIGDQRMISIIDIDNLMVIDTDDALLIAPKGSGQRVKQVVEKLKQSGSELPNLHRTAHRPWGTYTVLESANKYKIKRIVVSPDKRLSLQKHFHRSEHWIVVSGIATVTIGDQVQTIHPNESTYIPIAEKHQLANEGDVDLVLIEAQVGDYTEEDDIIRFDS